MRNFRNIKRPALVGHFELDQIWKRGILDDFVHALEEVKGTGVTLADSSTLFALLHDPKTSPQFLRAEAEKRARPYEAKHGRVSLSPDLSATRRLRIGYVSPYFRKHTNARIIAPSLRMHNRKEITIFCYSTTSKSDRATEQIRSTVENWREIHNVSEAAAAEIIRKDQIDILVDLAGHMAGSRLSLFALNPAPIQIQLGYSGTTGLPTMDYRITDAYSDPPGQTEAFYSERLLRLPCAWVYGPDSESPAIAPLPAQKNGYITFCSPNRAIKICDQAISLWRRILDSVPGSKLRLMAELPVEEAQHLLGRFAKQGIHPDRLEPVPRVPWKDYLRMFGEVDIVLDTFPFNGDTTSGDAMWMGVPIITLAGNCFHSRRGVSLLSHVGLSGFIAETPDQYVKIAVRLAKDLSYLAEIRSSLRVRMANCALTNGAGYTRALEAAYRQVWTEYCDKHSSAGPSDRKPITQLNGNTVIQSPLTLATAKEAFSMFQAGQREQGIELMKRCIQAFPNQPEIFNNYGVMLGQMGRRKEAIANFQEAIRLRPGYAAAYGNQGAAFEELQRHPEALENYQQAVKLSPQYADGHQNLSNVLRKLHRPQEAITSAMEAIRLRGKYPQALNSLGTAFLENEQPKEAQAAFEQALAIDPKLGDIHVNLATALLMQGNYRAGWSEYAWRNMGRKFTHTPQPWGTWRELDLSRKIVLISAEGGVGHVVQFARYAPMIAKRGGKAIIKCQSSIVPLLETLVGVHRVVEKGTKVPEANVRFPQRCLPQLFGTTLDTIPVDVPYLHPPEELVKKWRSQMKSITGFRVGVCWQGSQGSVHMRDRSFDSELLAPLSELPNVSLMNLQVGAKPSLKLRVADVPGYAYEKGDFLGLAAIIKNLDLVISCDTSIAHIAGALAKPVWAALRFGSDWRYMLNRDTCPWYPTMRLFRQSQPLDWKPVFNSVRHELERLAAPRG